MSPSWGDLGGCTLRSGDLLPSERTAPPAGSIRSPASGLSRRSSSSHTTLSRTRASPVSPRSSPARASTASPSSSSCPASCSRTPPDQETRTGASTVRERRGLPLYGSDGRRSSSALVGSGSTAAWPRPTGSRAPPASGRPTRTSTPLATVLGWSLSAEASFSWPSPSSSPGLLAFGRRRHARPRPPVGALALTILVPVVLTPRRPSTHPPGTGRWTSPMRPPTRPLESIAGVALALLVPLRGPACAGLLTDRGMFRSTLVRRPSVSSVSSPGG